jgi:hypothetical protein
VSGPAAAATVTVSLTAGCAWNASSDQPWLTITSATSGSGNATITYAVTANTTTTARTGRITVSGPGGSAQHTATQNGSASCGYVLSPLTQAAPIAGGSFSATLNAGCAWEASSDQPWLTITAGASGSGNATIIYSVANNSTTSGRIGHITVSGSGGTAQLTVNQGAPCTYSLSPTTASVPSGGGSGFSVSVAAGCAWTASSDQPWLTISTGSSGSGDGVIAYAVAANPNFTERIGRISLSGGDGSAQLTVTQAASAPPPNVPPPCSYQLSPNSQTATADGGIFRTSLTTDCGWTASSDVSWIFVNQGSTAGSGNAVIAYQVAINCGFGIPPRTGHVIVKGVNGTVELTVTQQPPPTQCIR